MTTHHDVRVHRGDLPTEWIEAVWRAPAVAWDIETTGLDFRVERIATCQLATADGSEHLIRIGPSAPPNLCKLLADEQVAKTFHHAMFDLRFMAFHWGVAPRNIRCTKVASKVLNPVGVSHSLKDLALRYLDVRLDKTERLSDWEALTLTMRQIEYAANDVRFLLPLMEHLRHLLAVCGRWPLAERCFDFIPARVELDLIGAEDVFLY